MKAFQKITAIILLSISFTSCIIATPNHGHYRGRGHGHYEGHRDHGEHRGHGGDHGGGHGDHSEHGRD